MDSRLRSHRGLLAALCVLFEFLAGLAVYGSTVAGDAGGGSLVVWVLRSLALAFFLLGTGAAAIVVFIELEPAPRGQKAVGLAMAVPLIAAAMAIGVYLGGWIFASSFNRESTSVHFASQLTHVLSGLSQERDKDLRRLDKADTRKEQAGAATALADAFSEREKMVLRMTVSSEERLSKQRIAAGLRFVSTAYAGLEGAALNHDGSQSKLDRARRRVNRAESHLRESQMRLARHGYLVIVPE
jgi:hypothetical protein